MQRPENLRFKPKEKAVPALWLELQREINILAALRHSNKISRNLFRDVVLKKICDDQVDVFECVAIPTIDATKSVLRLRVSRAFKLAIAEAANGFVLAEINHGNHLH